MNKRILFQCVLTVAVLTTLNSSEGGARARFLARSAQASGVAHATNVAASSGTSADVVYQALGIGQGDYAKAVHKAGTFGKVQGLELTHVMEHVIDPMVVTGDAPHQIWAQIQKLMSSKHTPEQKSHFYGELLKHIRGTIGNNTRIWEIAHVSYGMPLEEFTLGVSALCPDLNPDDGDALLMRLRDYGVQSQSSLANGIEVQERLLTPAASTVVVRQDSEGVAVREGVRIAITEGNPDDLNSVWQAATGYGMRPDQFVEGLDAIGAGY